MTAKPKTIRDEYSRAAEIAKHDGLIVKPVEIAGERVYVVVRPTNLSVHIVRREASGLVCDSSCACTKFGRYCAHRAATRMHLLADLEAAEAAADRIEAAATRMERATAQTAQRDTAMLASRADNRGFSIWASR
jgi:hypothetical protein